MKNKKTIYILLPVVVIIWGLIGYRIFSGLADKGNPVMNPIISNEKAQSDFRDSLTLLLNYRDPFLKSEKPVKTSVSKPSLKEIKKPAIINPNETLSWPSITYSGMIKNKTVNKTVGLLSINGNSIMIREGETISGVKVIKIYKDSVQLAMGKHVKAFKK